MATTWTTSSLTGLPLLRNNSSSSSADSDSQYNNYLELLNRLTRNRLSSQTDPGMSCANAAKDRVIGQLLGLPAEIRLCVLFWLEPSDILNLRAASHALHELVHESESAICHAFPRRVAASYGITLPRISLHAFSACIRQDLKYSAIAECAQFASQRITAFARHVKYSGDKEGLEKWRLRQVPHLTARITRSFILLQCFLDLFKEILVTNDHYFRCLTDDDYIALRNVYDLDQQNSLEAHMSWLTEQDFYDISCALGILHSICRARNVPFKRKGHTYPCASVRSILILQGIPAMWELWPRHVHPKKQCEKMNQLNMKLSPHQQPEWCKRSTREPLKSIHHLNGYDEIQEFFHEKITHFGDSRSQEVFLERQDLWHRAARAFMMRKLGRQLGHQSTTTWIQLAVVDGTPSKPSDVTLGPWDLPERA